MTLRRTASACWAAGVTSGPPRYSMVNWPLERVFNFSAMGTMLLTENMFRGKNVADFQTIDLAAAGAGVAGAEVGAAVVAGAAFVGVVCCPAHPLRIRPRTIRVTTVNHNNLRI